MTFTECQIISQGCDGVKTLLVVTQWCSAVLSALCRIAVGFRWTDLLLLVAVLFIMPFAVVQNVLEKRKAKRWVVGLLAVLFFVAFFLIALL